MAQSLLESLRMTLLQIPSLVSLQLSGVISHDALIQSWEMLGVDRAIAESVYCPLLQKFDLACQVKHSNVSRLPSHACVFASFIHSQ